MDVPTPFVQFGETSTGVELGSHSFTEDATSVAPIAFVAITSFSNKFFV